MPPTVRPECVWSWFAAEGERAYGRVVPPQAAGKRHLVLRCPIGVVGGIPPWNFPLMLALRKVGPALAAGCPVILKPASATPLCALQFAEAVHEVQLPPGVFQLVVGRADEIAAEMLENPLCRKISFTGSTEVGRELIRGAADQVTKLSLELGGHAPVLVFDDADLNIAVQGVLAAKFCNTGQSCIAANRVYVQRSVYPQFVAQLVARTRALKIGNGLEDGVEIGPLIGPRALEQALAHIEQAVSAGAKVLCGGRRWPDEPRGCFPDPQRDELARGPQRNFQILDPLDFLAEFTQHIPPKGAHLIRGHRPKVGRGWYSNKARGMRRKAAKAAGAAAAAVEPVTASSSGDAGPAPAQCR